jgi:two-component system nitrogen regulation response regulator GlnG
MQNGAFDYLPKPFDLEQAAAVIDRALTQRQPVQTSGTRDLDLDSPQLLGRSPAMQEVFKRIALVAPTDASVLITGESGTGKELVAQAIHRHSQRAHAAFVPIHLAALSPALVESELFGHVRGAFTGAESSRQGLLELAAGGTVFFDEAGDIPPGVQVKLLRVLEQHELTPVGSASPRATSFRVIAATHRDLRDDGDASFVRRDLYFRLAAFEIAIPPLRRRAEDIPFLAEHFLRVTQGSGSIGTAFTPEAIAELCQRSWPGNVRELRHAVEHGALLARGGRIAPEHLPAVTEAPISESAASGLQSAVRTWSRQQLEAGALEGQLYQGLLAQIEPPLFETVLQSTAGNRAAAADLLGLHRATLRKKLQGDGPETT